MIDDLARRVVAAPRPTLLALDVDGTLAPIVEDPLAARVPPDVLRDVGAIALDLDVALITGRDAAALSVVAPIEGVWRAVEHGRVRISPEGEVFAPPVPGSSARALEAFDREVTGLIRRGARLERKPAARAVHVRGLAGPLAAELLAAAAETGASLELDVRHGRGVVEVEASAGDKGVALAAIADHAGAGGVAFAGDDLTDAPALEEARRRGGLAIFVRSRERPEPPTEVDATLDGPGDVARLIAAIRRRLASSS